MDGLPILFVAGLHRSGTSVLTRVLGTSAGLHTMTGTGVPEDEGQHVQDVVRTAAAHGGPGLFAFDPGARLTERSRLATAANAQRLVEQWSPYWASTDGIVVEKSPPTLVRTRLFQALFPDARFLVVIRHPGVVAASTRRWAPRVAPEVLVRHWLVAHRCYRTDRAHLRRVHELRYEDLVADPRAELRRASDALDLPRDIDPSALEDGHSAAHLDEWERLRHGADPAVWRGLERQVRPYGYSLQQPYVLP